MTSKIKETNEMMELGVLAVDFRRTLKKLTKMKKLAKVCRKQAVSTERFRSHQFSGFLATLAKAEAAVLEVDQAHSDVSDLLEVNGIEMCTQEEFKAAQKTLNRGGGGR